MNDSGPTERGWYDASHLAQAWRHLTVHPASGNPRVPPVGVDGVTAARVSAGPEPHFREILRLLHQLDADDRPRYHFAPVLAVERTKPGGESRTVHIPRLRDQLVLRMVHDELSASLAAAGWPVRPSAPAQVVGLLRQRIAQERPQFALKADLASFYPSVPRTRVLAALEALPGHPLTRALLGRWSAELVVRPAWWPGKSRDYRIDGLPQGVSVAASLAEFWAMHLDRALLASGFRFHRYVDDLLLLTNDQTEAERGLDALLDATAELGLSTSPAKTRIVRLTQGVPWLGLIHFGDRVVIEPSRRDKWLRRIAYLRKIAGDAIATATTPEAKLEAVQRFVASVRDEVWGGGHFRLRWYAHVNDTVQWQGIDQFIRHAVHSAYRQAGLPAPESLKLPSVSRSIAMLQRRREEG